MFTNFCDECVHTKRVVCSCNLIEMDIFQFNIESWPFNFWCSIQSLRQVKAVYISPSGRLVHSNTIWCSLGRIHPRCLRTGRLHKLWPAVYSYIRIYTAQRTSVRMTLKSQYVILYTWLLKVSLVSVDWFFSLCYPTYLLYVSFTYFCLPVYYFLSLPVYKCGSLWSMRVDLLMVDIDNVFSSCITLLVCSLHQCWWSSTLGHCLRLHKYPSPQVFRGVWNKSSPQMFFWLYVILWLHHQAPGDSVRTHGCGYPLLCHTRNEQINIHHQYII